MQAREKILVYILAAVALVAILVVAVGSPWASVTAKKNQLAAIDARIDGQNEDISLIQQASRQMGLWKQQSLPPDEKDAQRLYLAWVTSLAQEIGFDDLVVTPGRTNTKGNDYIAVQIDLTGRTNFDHLVRFLHHFEEADLLHRISSLVIDSESSQGDPMLDVKLSAEGIALLEAPPRSRLFPATKLASTIDAKAKKIEIVDAKGFPRSGPFLVRIGNEVIKVSNVKNKTWTVSRGEYDSQAVEHVSGVEIHLGKYNPLLDTAGLQELVAEHRQIIQHSPFVLPQVFNPLIQNLGKHTVLQERPFEIDLHVKEYDPSLGTPTFRFKEEAPKGMQIDAKTGKITWNTTKEDRLGDYDITIVALQTAGEKPIPEGTLKLELRKFNNKPVIVAIDDIEIYPGRSVEFQATAEDKDDAKEPEGKIAFSLKDAPEGATIDKETGKFSWKIDGEFKAGDYKFSVVATDHGAQAESAEESLTITVLKDAAQDVQLVGTIIEEGEKSQAYFLNQSDEKTTPLTKGDAFEWGTVKGVIADIGGDFVHFRYKNSLWKIDLKQTISAMQKVADITSKKTASGKKITD